MPGAAHLRRKTSAAGMGRIVDAQPYLGRERIKDRLVDIALHRLPEL
jgi:hypothetical protein